MVPAIPAAAALPRINEAPVRPDVSVRFEAQRQIFAEKAAQYATITLANMRCFNLPDDTETLNILKDVPAGGTVWQAYSRNFTRIYTSQYGDTPDTLLGKIAYKVVKQWRYVRSFFIIKLLQNFLADVINDFSFNAISALTEGLGDHEKDLTQLIDALVEIVGNHFQKYTHALQSYRGEELDGSFSDHAVEEMKMIGRHTQEEILSDFTKIVAKFLPDFKPLQHMRKSQYFLKRLVGYIFLPFDLFFSVVVGTVARKAILPKLTDLLLEEGAKATTNNPFSFAITSSLIEQLEELVPTLKLQASGAAPIEDAKAGAMGYISEGAVLGIKNIANNLMRVMALRADLANAAHKKDDKKQKSFIERQVLAGMEVSIKDLTHLGLRSLTNERLQDLLEKFLTSTNQYWNAADGPDVEALNAKRDELSTQMDEVLLLSVQTALRKKLKGANPRLAGGGILGSAAAIAGGIAGGPLGAGLGLALGGLLGRKSVKEIERTAQGITRENVDQLYGAVHELGHTQCAALNAMEVANQRLLRV